MVLLLLSCVSFMLNVIMPNVTNKPFMLNVIMPNVTNKPFMLRVFMLKVMAPLYETISISDLSINDTYHNNARPLC
jgi:hypothetical protein